MNIKGKKRFLSWVIAFLMVFTYVPATAYAADNEGTDTVSGTAVAAESGVTVLDGQIRIVDSLGNATATDNTVNLTAPGSPRVSSVKTNNVTIYNDSNEYIILNFNYKAENYGAFSETSTVEATTTGTKRHIMKPGEYITLSIKGINDFGDNTARLELSGFEISVIPESSDLTFMFDDSLGVVKVNGEAIGDGESKSVNYLDGGELTAEPLEGVRFIGWVNSATSELVSNEVTYIINPSAPMTIEAAFAGKDTKPYYLVGNTYILNDFHEAIEKTAVVGDKTVVLLNDVTLTAGNYVVPAGVTLLIPFDDEYTLYEKKPGATNADYETPYAYCTLTLAEGAELVVDGAVSLSAKHFAANGGGRGSGAPTGPVSYLVTEKGSTVTVNSGGTLYAYGFVTGTGNVIAKDDAVIYELFQIEDFRGGEVTLNIAYTEMAKGLLPISQYYVQNIEVPLTFEAGATEYVYASLFTQGQIYGADVQFIGNSKAMFYLEDGTVVKAYDGKTDRLVIDVDGNIDLSSISVEMAGTGLDSSMFDIPINSNISVNLNSGSATISQDMALLPGSEINIAEGTVCTLEDGINVFVYDLEQWIGYVGVNNENFIPSIFSPSRTYTRTEDDLKDAAIRVDGTLDASKGFIYTTTDKDSKGGGANIYSTGNGVVRTGTGAPPALYQYVQGDEDPFKLIDLLPVNIKNSDGKYVQTFETEVGTYTYTDGQWMCEHEIIKEVQTKTPTCAEYGEKVVTCAMEEVQAGYGHTYTVRVDKLPHTEVIDDAVEATCTETGLTEGKHCSVCKKVLVEQETVDALGHAWGDEYFYDVPPTCTTQGVGTIHCDRCDVEKEDSEQYIDALGHSYKWELTSPTCTGIGMKSGICTRLDCGHTVSFVQEASGHDYQPVVTEPTCTEGGYTTYTCSKCDDTYTADETEVLGHQEVQKPAKEATCTEAGYTAGVWCERCETAQSGMEPVDQLKHNLGEWIIDDAPTCTEEGRRHKECENCDYVEIDVMDATGHSEVIIDAVAPECTKTGLTEGVKCSVCGEVLLAQEIVDALDHKEVVDPAVEPTCTETGLTEGKHCSVCNEILLAQETVDAAGHTEVIDAAKSPTCMETGLTEGKHCSVCNEILLAQETVDAAGHTEVIDAAESPTCTETGLTEGKHCSVCNELLVVQETVEALGHDCEYFDGKESTCTEKGYEPYEKCKVCDYITYKEIQAAGHVYQEHAVDATCTEDGYIIKHCKCGDEIRVEGEKAKGHLFTEYKEIAAATCQKKGKTKAECDRGCGAVDVAETELGEHKQVTDAAVAATCTETGLTEGKHCSVCEKVLVAQETVGVLPHNAEKHDAKASTCTAIGWDAYETCKDCDYTTYREVATISHKNAYEDAGKAETCTADGWTAGKFCPDCDKWLEGHDVIPAAHRFGEEQYQAPTSKAAGGNYVVCSECGETEWTQVQTYKEYVKSGVTATTLKATASASAKTEYITVKWTNSSKFGITYYNVYRSTSGKTGTFGYIGKTTTKSYVDKKAKAGQTYYYKVIGYRDVEGSTYKTKTSAAASAKIRKVTAAAVKAVPMYISTDYVSKGVQVMWTAPSVKMDGYQIYRATSANGKYKLVKETKSTVKSWSNTGLKAGKRYYYKVRGFKYVNGKRVYTKFSAKSYRYVLKGTNAKLAAAITGSDSVKVKSAVKASGGIKVTWSKAASVKCTKYEVWRATSKNGKYTKIATTKTQYYTDKMAKSGTRYYYKVRGYRTFGKASAVTNYSNTVSGKR